MNKPTSVPFRLPSTGDTKFNRNHKAKLFNDKTIKHAQFKQAMNALNNTFEFSASEGYGMILDGEPGVGKTKTLNAFVTHFYKEFSKHTKIYDEEVVRLPIISIGIPSRPTMPRVIEQILIAARHIKPTGSSIKTLENRLRTVIEEQEVQMLIFDEYQHLLRAEKYTRDTLNFIKVMADEYKLAIVLSGLPHGIDSLINHEELLEKLSLYHVTMKAFNNKSAVNYLDYLSYLMAIDNALSEIEIDCCQLATEDFAPRLLLATKGKPRLISQLIKHLILESKGKMITQKRFMEEFPKTSINKTLGVFNPFSPKAKMNAIEDRLNEQSSK